MINESKYTLTTSVVLRTPAYSYLDYDAFNKLPVLLNDPYFRSSISLASKSLFRQLQAAGFTYECLDDKTKFSVHKYFNRMCYRPTPFGQFAGFTLVPWGAGQQVVVSDDPIIHTHLSFGDAVQKAGELVHLHLQDELKYKVNGSLYRLKGEYRYLRYSSDELTAKRTFFVHSVGRSYELDRFISHLSIPRSKRKMISLIAASFKFSLEDSDDLFGQLLQEQIIAPELQPMVTGPDYLETIQRTCSLQLLDQSFITVPCIEEPENEPELYVNLENKIKTGSISKKYQEQIIEGLDAIDLLVPEIEHNGLQNFKRRFIEKFDRRLIPLMEALDPEIGIGYESLAGITSSSVLLRDMDIKPQEEQTQQINWSAVHAYLLHKWNVKGSDSVIRLYQSELDMLPKKHSDYPQSMSVLFRLTNDLIFIELAGGVSATALNGRFTLFNDALFDEARQLAQIEQEANPDVVFTEINHYDDVHTANVERRRHIRAYEIPILCGSSLSDDRQIELSDLWVMVADDRIILWSEKLQKPVIPRLSSAYNHARSELAAFRLLCDLQYQGLKTDFNFDLSSYFPDLDFYPRVQFGDIILQLANWRLREDRLALLDVCKDASEKITLLKKWGADLQWPHYISLNNHDNQMVFDTSDERSLLFLADNLKSLKGAEIKEFIFRDNQTDGVVDESGKPRIYQMVASLYHMGNIYKQPSQLQFSKDAQIACKRKFIPGSEWLYCKLYCHPSRANEILRGWIEPLFASGSMQNKITQWFFIRYNDPAYHLRIRINTRSEHVGAIINILRFKFSKQVDSGAVSDLQINVYERELERYSSIIISDVEQLFCSSSALIVCFLQNITADESTINYYQIAFGSITKMADAFGFSLEEKIGIFHDLHVAFVNEFGQAAKLNDQIKRKYRELRTDSVRFSEQAAYPNVEALIICQKLFDQSCAKVAGLVIGWPYEKRIQLFGDLVHMHLNRLLVDDARKQELLLYYCLYKNYQSEKGRAASARLSSLS